MKTRQLINTAGIKVIKISETFRAETYDDARPNHKLKTGEIPTGTLTIGWGHTGPEAYIGNRISPTEADEILELDMGRAERTVSTSVENALTSNQFSALVSLVYNIGSEAFRKSTLLKLLNDGNYIGASEQFKRWVYDRGEKLPGLIIRREREKLLFLKCEVEDGEQSV